MAEIAGFSDLLSQLSPFFQPPASRQEAPEAPAGSALPKADELLLSQIPSDRPGASFDSGQQVAVAQDGTYRPQAVRAERQFGMALSFEFNLSIQREATFVRPASEEGGGHRGILSVLESSSLSYRSSRFSASRAIGSSFGEVRQFQANLFYSRSRELRARFDDGLGDRFDETSRRVSRTFEMNISLEASFLGQFLQQSDEISSLDLGLFEEYLNNTDRLAGGEGLQAFFNDVGRILEETEAFLQETLGEFFEGVAEQFDLTAAEAGALQEMVAGEIAAFFDEVDSFLDEARTALAGSGGAGAVPEPEPAPAVEAPAEEDTELALV